MFAEHFGFNTNILETNVLNLAVVLAVVVTFVGDALRSLLENRKQNILNNFREADQRASEAQERLNKARLQLEQAQTKAKQIRDQALVTIEQEKNQIVRQNQEDIKRLSVLQQETLQFEQQKVQNELAQKLVRLALPPVNISNAVDNNSDLLFSTFLIVKLSYI